MHEARRGRATAPRPPRRDRHAARRPPLLLRLPAPDVAGDRRAREGRRPVRALRLAGFVDAPEHGLDDDVRPTSPKRLLRIPDDKTTLAEVFHEHGYATGAFICNDLLSPENRFERGFDTFEWKLVPYGSNQPILDWIRAHKDGRTFTFVHLNEVHDDVKRPDGSNYGPDPVAQKGRFRKEKGAISAERSRVLRRRLREAPPRREGREPREDRGRDRRLRRRRRVLRPPRRRDPRGVQEARPVGLDRRRRSRRTTAKVSGRASNFLRARADGDGARASPPTLVNTLQMTHGSQAAIELVHVPFILKAPGFDAARVGVWVENVDIGPTLLELCRLRGSENGARDGVSWVSQADPGDGRKTRRGRCSAYTRFQWSMITQDGNQLLHPTLARRVRLRARRRALRSPARRRSAQEPRREPAEAAGPARTAGEERVKDGIHGGDGNDQRAAPEVARRPRLHRQRHRRHRQRAARRRRRRTISSAESGVPRLPAPARRWFARSRVASSTDAQKAALRAMLGEGALDREMRGIQSRFSALTPVPFALGHRPVTLSRAQKSRQTEFDLTRSRHHARQDQDEHA